MACLVRIVIPKGENEHSATKPTENGDGVSTLKELPMEDAVRRVLTKEGIQDDIWTVSRRQNCCAVEFSVTGSHEMERVLDRLAFFNIGKTSDSSIMVIEPTAFIQKRTKKCDLSSSSNLKKFVGTLKSRLCVAQVFNEINQRGSFDMNYLCFLVCAAVIADIALVTNSAAVVFASMLLSPLMDPIMCILFGLTLRDRSMILKGARNTIISLAISVFIGLSFGYPMHVVAEFQQVSPYPTSEMVQRGEIRSFIASALVAGFSGISISFATLSKRVSAIIGNAISLSLLPPAVNCGQFLLLIVLASTPTYERGLDNNTICSHHWLAHYKLIYVDDVCELSKEFLYMAVASLGLVSMNIALILVTGYSVNKLKNLVPLSFTNEVTKRFYQKDTKEVRDNYQKCVHKFDAANLAQYAYNEYLRLSKGNESEQSLDVIDIVQSSQIAKRYQDIVDELQNDGYLNTISAKSSHGQSKFLEEFFEKSRALSHTKSTSAGFNQHCGRSNWILGGTDTRSTSFGDGPTEVTDKPQMNSSTELVMRSTSQNHTETNRISSSPGLNNPNKSIKVSSSTGRFEVVHIESEPSR